MAQKCDVLLPEDFVLSLLTKPNMREKYQQFAFCDYVKSHPQLRFCPGPNCQIVVRSKEQLAKRVICTTCKTVFWYAFKIYPHIEFYHILTKNYTTVASDVVWITTHPLTAIQLRSGWQNVWMIQRQLIILVPTPKTLVLQIHTFVIYLLGFSNKWICIFTVSKMSHLHRKKWWLQSHAMLQL